MNKILLIYLKWICCRNLATVSVSVILRSLLESTTPSLFFKEILSVGAYHFPVFDSTIGYFDHAPPRAILRWKVCILVEELLETLVIQKFWCITRDSSSLGLDMTCSPDMVINSSRFCTLPSTSTPFSSANFGSEEPSDIENCDDRGVWLVSATPIMFLILGRSHLFSNMHFISLKLT